ncbi:MAG: hypothetical protein TREMPRED_003776 [Tremellales sp. Tagirdzhanova-0007]|nr:MAG: hypothetical protein TREMPRED_003776 [Tremellales sp. Tagirdzhanova-0007]
MLFVGISSLAASLLDIKPYLHLQLVPHITKYHQFWRILSHPFAFANSTELLMGELVLYNVGVGIERRVIWSPQSFILISSLLSTLLCSIAIIVFHKLGLKSIPAGPYGVIFSLAWQHYRTVPSLYSFHILGLELSNRLFMWIFCLQLFLSKPPASILAAFTGLFAGWLYRTDTLVIIPSLSRRRAFRPLKSYRIPSSIHTLLARVFNPIVGSSAPPRRANRVLPGQVAEFGARTTAVAQPSLRSLLAGRTGEGPVRRTSAGAGTASRPSQTAVPSVSAGAGAARAVMGEWVSEMAGTAGAGPRAPSEDEITTLSNMFPGLGREIIVGALQRSDHNTAMAVEVLLQEDVFELEPWLERRDRANPKPRRVAATSVATRVAEEVGSVLGDEVGYTIRFEDLSSPSRTRIKYMTDGMLFRETMQDPLLSRYSVIMIDEAHERGAYTDLLLGLLKKIMKKRPELRVIISSATIDAQDFLEYFNSNADGADRSADDAIVVSLEGRMFPVEVCYLRAPCVDYVEAAIQTVFDIHMKEPAGDVLVFLTGREEIDQALQQVADRIQTLPKSAPKILPLPLYSTLPPEEQALIFELPPRDTRKIIFATNIAEASVTIDGIKYVVDSGFVKLKTYNPRTCMDVLSVTPCSLASVNQRAGRAGRTSAGKCFRLFPSSALPSRNPRSAMPVTTPPELTRSDISLYLLQLKALGIDNLAKFDFMSPPPSEMMIRALEFLFCLKAIEDEGRLTQPMGSRMAEVPLDPMMAAILLNSHEFKCGEEILTIAAMTQVQNVFIFADGGTKATMAELERRKFTAEEGDHLTLLNAYNAFTRYGARDKQWCGNHRINHKALSRAVSIRKQLKKYLDRFGIPVVSCEGDGARLRRCLVTGYFKNAARMLPDGTYRSAREGAALSVHPSSVMFTRKPSTGWVIYHEVVETTKSFMRDLTVADADF